MWQIKRYTLAGSGETTVRGRFCQEQICRIEPFSPDVSIYLATSESLDLDEYERSFFVTSIHKNQIFEDDWRWVANYGDLIILERPVPVVPRTISQTLEDIKRMTNVRLDSGFQHFDPSLQAIERFNLIPEEEPRTKTCKHCGKPIELVNFAMRPEWRHYIPGSSFQDGQYKYCQKTAAEPS